MNAIEVFNSIRDIPYRIPLSVTDTSVDCIQKHRMLAQTLSEGGLKVRFRTCSFLWSAMPIPKKILDITHVDKCEHLFLEVLGDNGWLILDATWDNGLQNIFPVNEWDGKSNTKIAVNPLEIFPESKTTVDYVANEETIMEDLRTSGAFYAAFNTWLEKNRK